jgi:2-keto-4-pentenoate hydratase/2-oxohepta-3-ene-1,7-dioic acid hydratase in catechol pathway
MNKFWEFGRKIVAIGRNYAEHAKGTCKITIPSCNLYVSDLSK